MKVLIKNIALYAEIADKKVHFIGVRHWLSIVGTVKTDIMDDKQNEGDEMQVAGSYYIDDNEYIYSVDLDDFKSRYNLRGGYISRLMIWKENEIVAEYQSGWIKAPGSKSGVYKIVGYLISEFNSSLKTMQGRRLYA